jgi:hypothetical protein
MVERGDGDGIGARGEGRITDYELRITIGYPDDAEIGLSLEPSAYS